MRAGAVRETARPAAARPGLVKGSLGLAVCLAGATATLAQVILVREFLVTFGGNELYIGIILGNWLLSGALGSLLSSRVRTEPEGAVGVYMGLQMAIAIMLPTAVYAVRVARSLFGLIPGQAVGFSSVLFASLVLLAPLAMAHGAQFAAGCRIHAKVAEEQASSIAWVYVCEAVGTLGGGIIFTFLLVSRFNSMETLLGVAALNLASAVVLGVLWMRRSGHSAASGRLGRAVPLLLAAVVLLGSAGYLLLGGGSGSLHAESIRKQWEPQDLLYYGNSPHGNIAVVERDGEFTFYSSGLPVITTPYPDETLVEELAHLPLLFHGSPRRVLLLGGGVGGMLNEVLKHPVEQVDYVEPDPSFVGVVRRFQTPLTESELGDPRLHIIQADGRAFVAGTRQLYDVVIVNLPPPSTLQLNRFYTLEFFQAVRDVLDEKGLLAVRCPGSQAYVSEELAGLVECLRLTLEEVFPYVRPVAGDPILLLASPSSEIAVVTPGILFGRLEDRGFETRFLTDADFVYRLNQERTDELLASLDRVSDVRVNRDLVPAGLLEGMSLLGALAFPTLARALELMKRASLWTFALPLALLVAAAVVLGRRRGKVARLAVPLAVGANGFAGMALQIVLILAFQSLYGNVYQIIGLLIAAFMAGLAAGSVWMTGVAKRTERAKRTGPSLVRLESLVLVQAVLVLIALGALYAHLDRPAVFVLGQAVILALSLLTGALVGGEYALAAAVYVLVTSEADARLGAGRTPGVGKAAGTLYSADLLGGWLGALLVSAWFIPVLGLQGTCVLVAGLKGASLILVWSSAPSKPAGGSPPQRSSLNTPPPSVPA